MGIFHEQVQVFNRTPIDLNVRFDGQDMVLKPGVNSIPRVALPYAKNQNPVMGSQDPTNPALSGASFLIGVVAKKGERQRDNIEPMTIEEWEAHLKRPMRLDEVALFEERYGADPKARMVLHGKPNSVPARNVSEAGASAGAQSASSFENDK